LRRLSFHEHLECALSRVEIKSQNVWAGKKKKKTNKRVKMSCKNWQITAIILKKEIEKEDYTITVLF
jgi:hypothetical protein